METFLRQFGLTLYPILPVLILTGLLALCLPERSLAAGAAVPVAPLSSAQDVAVPVQNATQVAPAQQEKTTPPRLAPPAEPYPRLSVPPIAWRTVDKGLEVGTAVVHESRVNQRDAVFVFIRVAPDQHTFSLHMASHAGQSHSFAEWSRMGNLKAGVNASMYLPDNITSTGYMRDGHRVNNAKIGNRLGAFFVAGRRNRNNPHADIVEKDTPGWREAIDSYDLVVQNYRIISSAGKILWPEGGPEHSIAVITTDNKGRVLFILCQEPLTVARFSLYLHSFELGLDTVLYVEGGAQAGAFVRMKNDAAHPPLPGATPLTVDGDTVYVWKGRQSLLDLKGSPNAVLPNIIGVQR